MSRRLPGARAYRFYTERQLELCISDIQNKNLTQRQAAARYGIPRSSIILKLKAIKERRVRKPGRQCIFSPSEEAAFVQHAIAMCDYGFPITMFDLRCVVKAYLDKQGKSVPQFNNNLPGRTWAKAFLERQKGQLSQRFCSNIKRVRAAVDEEAINAYIDALKTEVEGVQAHLIYNYDETNLVDDPGKKKILTKRGTKYPEAIKNSTKAAVSIMICGNAAGNILPPYVNYKADHLWDTWTEGGPPGTRYNRSKSGWFDTNSFEDWFFTIVLPAVRREEGKKLLIGDNLSSHISYDVLKACEEHNIAFVALPPNSTHLTQPLDVAYFRPFKIHWRNVIDGWKSTEQGLRSSTVQKNIFPTLLSKLWEKVIPRTEENLKAGFKKTGIYPVDAAPLLARLPGFKNPEQTESSASNDPSLVPQSFMEFLERKRQETVAIKAGVRKKKLNVQAGKSISSEEVLKLSLPSTSKSLAGQNKKPGRKPKKNEHSSESSESGDDIAMNLADSSDSDGPLIEEESSDQASSQPEESHDEDHVVEDYVVVEYEGESWPGQIKKKEKDGAYVKCLARCGLSWKWPEREDVIFYPDHKIKYKINAPKKLSSKRDLYQVPELEYRWGKPKK